MHRKKPISVLILATMPDHGIKSLGSKSLFKLKEKLIIEYQLENITSALKDRDYEIIFLCGFDSQKTIKSLNKYSDKFPIKFIKHNNNLNFVGSFLAGLNTAKYNNVLSINYGCVFSKSVITQLLNTTINRLVVAKENRHNNHIKVGCHINQEKIINIFFNLGQYKYLDMNFWSHQTVEYIKQHFSFDDNKNKFMFEIINTLIDANHEFDYYAVSPYDCVFIDSIASLTKSKRIFKNGKTNNKKTKY